MAWTYSFLSTEDQPFCAAPLGHCDANGVAVAYAYLGQGLSLGDGAATFDGEGICFGGIVGTRDKVVADECLNYLSGRQLVVEVGVQFCAVVYVDECQFQLSHRSLPPDYLNCRS